MYSLDNLWDGLGAILINHPEVKFMFGKIAMYRDFDPLARDLVLFFLNRYFPDKDKLLTPLEPLKIVTSQKVLKSIFTGDNYDEDYRILIQKVRSLNENIPPLVNAYMNLSSTMRTFGTSMNKFFGNVEETGILITAEDIYDIKKDRHLGTYSKK